MNRLAKSIERLQPKVMADVDAAKAERKAKWERIKTEAPEIAEFLTDINAAFGKPARVRVDINGERVL